MTNLDRIDYISRGLQEFPGSKLVFISIQPDELVNLTKELQEEYCDCSTAYVIVKNQSWEYELKIFNICFILTIIGSAPQIKLHEA